MRITKEELSDILSQTTTMLGELLATLGQLREGLADQRQTAAQQDKIDRIKRDLEDEREELKALRRRQQHKRELEQLRNQRQKPSQKEGKTAGGMVALRNARGQLLGLLQTVGNDRVNILDAGGKLVAREIREMTLDRSGRLVGRGKLGLAVLGRKLPANAL